MPHDDDDSAGPPTSPPPTLDARWEVDSSADDASTPTLPQSDAMRQGPARATLLDAPHALTAVVCYRLLVRALTLKVERHRARAVRHVARRGFEDIAQDAVSEALLFFVRKAREPSFTPPDDERAWLYCWSVCCAYVMRRRGGGGGHVPFDEEVEAHARACAEFAERDLPVAPDHGLLVDAEERARKDWRARIRCARAELPPLDGETFDAEVARIDRGDTAPPRHRKRLERARPRARRVFARHGLTSARAPDDMPPPAAPATP